MKLRTYLNYGGNCKEAFQFYEKHLGGKILTMMTHADQPEPKNIAAGWEKAILFARMRIGEMDIMASDVPPEHFKPMRSVYLSLNLDSTDEAERVYELLKEGGEIFMPMTETFFAFRFGMLRDRFGTSWMVLHEKPAPGS